MKKTQHGFSVVEGLLILVIVGMIVGTGWYVMSANSKTNDTLNNSGLGTAAKVSKKKQVSNPAPQADPTANWVAYSSKIGKYSLKYPSGWYKAVPINGCEVDDTLLLLGANKDSTGRYCSDGGGQITIYSNKGDHRFKLGSDNYKNIISQNITIDSVSGTKETGTASGQMDHAAIGSLPDGTKAIFYLFYTNNRTYVAEYHQTPSNTDIASDFDLMVTKTFKFSAN